jgi:NADH:ubiquinone oxidoreductase subunit 5 (subunit L)/multisubunit Na+/H+ antiporter MnhA subunit
MVNSEIKKVLAYSTGSQIGYMMMVLGIAGLSEQFVNGYTAGFFHLISHAMFKASLFMAAGSLLHAPRRRSAVQTAATFASTTMPSSSSATMATRRAPASSAPLPASCARRTS